MKDQNLKTSGEAAAAEDDKLSALLKQDKAPSPSPKMDKRTTESYRTVKQQVEIKAAEADIKLRGSVARSLIYVFAFSVFFTSLIILLIGFNRISLPAEVIYLLLGSTITQAVVLYRRVIADIFSVGSKIDGDYKGVS